MTAHLAGACDDVLEGRLDGVASDEWTAAQVVARADRSLDEILDEWAEVGPRVEELFGDGGVHPQMLFDEVTHEHDVRSALDRPGARGEDRGDPGPLVPPPRRSPRRCVGRVRPCSRSGADDEELVLGDGDLHRRR